MEWQSLQEGALRNLAAGQNRDGRLEVFGTASDDSVWHIWQTSPNGGWGLWESLQEGALRNLAVGQNQDGRLEVFGTASDDSVWHIWQLEPGKWIRSIVRLHAKVLTTPLIAISTQLERMREAYASCDIRVELASTESLNLPLLTDLDVGACTRGQTPTAEQTQLFANRNNAGANDVVVYFIRATTGQAGPLNGCASHPAGRPGAVVTQIASRFTLGHEVGHVLGLAHCDSPGARLFDRLMTGGGTNNITNPPPDLIGSECDTMDASAFSQDP